MAETSAAWPLADRKSSCRNRRKYILSTKLKLTDLIEALSQEILDVVQQAHNSRQLKKGANEATKTLNVSVPSLFAYDYNQLTFMCSVEQASCMCSPKIALAQR